jgi:hypothetical protein
MSYINALLSFERGFHKGLFEKPKKKVKKKKKNKSKKEDFEDAL